MKIKNESKTKINNVEKQCGHWTKGIEENGRYGTMRWTALHWRCRSLKELSTLTMHCRTWYILAYVHVNMHIIVSSYWRQPFIFSTSQYSRPRLYLYSRRAVVACSSFIHFILLNLPLAFVMVKALCLTSICPLTSHWFSLFPISFIHFSFNSSYLTYFIISFFLFYHHFTTSHDSSSLLCPINTLSSSCWAVMIITVVSMPLNTFTFQWCALIRIEMTRDVHHHYKWIARTLVLAALL